MVQDLAQFAYHTLDCWMKNVPYSSLHLGASLFSNFWQVLSSVWKYDFTSSNLNHAQFEKLKADRIPDVILVKKVFDRPRRSRRRNWKLRRMAEGLDTESVERDYTEFLEDLEEDPEMRQGVNIYKDGSKVTVEMSEAEDDDAPTISLQEMLDDLHLAEDATGGEGAPMME
ncbi:hypothetical protein ACOMHN_038758 [Nucella lapillus]